MEECIFVPHKNKWSIQDPVHTICRLIFYQRLIWAFMVQVLAVLSHGLTPTVFFEFYVEFTLTSSQTKVETHT